MGKAYQGVFGAWTKKVGNVVGRIRQGVNIYSIYQPNVANPRTPAQVANRAKFSALSQLLSVLGGFIKVGFAKLDGYKYGSPFSSALGYNQKRGVASYDAGTGLVSIAYNELAVSDGTIDLPYSATATASGTDVSASWADNSGHGNALATDQVMLCVLNTDKNDVTYTTSLATRTQRAGTLTVPSAWGGDNIEVYLAVRREDSGECSATAYLGNFTL